MINWQLSKQGIRWPVSPDRIAGSGVDPSRSSIFLKLSADKLLVFKWSQAQVCFLKIYVKYVVFMSLWPSLWPSTIKILLLNLPRTRKFSQLLKNTGGEDQFLTMVTCWSLSTSNFYALIGQNLTDEFMWKFYATSWNLLTLTAEADRVLCQLFNRLFPLDVQNEIRLLSGVFSYSWPVCLLFFCLRDASLVKVGNPISDGIVFVFGLACCVRGFKKKVSNDSGLTW